MVRCTWELQMHGVVVRVGIRLILLLTCERRCDRSTSSTKCIQRFMLPHTPPSQPRPHYLPAAACCSFISSRGIAVDCNTRTHSSTAASSARDAA